MALQAVSAIRSHSKEKDEKSMELKEQAIKAAARRIAKKTNLTHSNALEELSAAFGYASWNVFKSELKGSAKSTTPTSLDVTPKWTIIELSQGDIKSAFDLKEILGEYKFFDINGKSKRIYESIRSEYKFSFDYILNIADILDVVYFLINKRVDTDIARSLTQAVSREGFSKNIALALSSKYLSCVAIHKNEEKYRLAYTNESGFEDYGIDFFKFVLLNYNWAYAKAIMSRNLFGDVKDCILDEAANIDDIFVNKIIPDFFAIESSQRSINDGFILGCSVANRAFQANTVFSKLNKNASITVAASEKSCAMTKKLFDTSNTEFSNHHEFDFGSSRVKFIKGFIARSIMLVFNGMLDRELLIVYNKDGSIASRIPNKAGEIIFSLYDASGNKIKIKERKEEFDFNKIAEGLSNTFSIGVTFDT